MPWPMGTPVCILSAEARHGTSGTWGCHCLHLCTATKRFTCEESRCDRTGKNNRKGRKMVVLVNKTFQRKLVTSPLLTTGRQGHDDDEDDRRTTTYHAWSSSQIPAINNSIDYQVFND